MAGFRKKKITHTPCLSAFRLGMGSFGAFRFGGTIPYIMGLQQGRVRRLELGRERELVLLLRKDGTRSARNVLREGKGEQVLDRADIGMVLGVRSAYGFSVRNPSDEKQRCRRHRKNKQKPQNWHSAADGSPRLQDNLIPLDLAQGS